MKPDWRIVEQEHAGLSVRTSRFLGEGWNSHAYLVNEELVFRFPKRAECWSELRREMAFLDAVADHLPLKVPRYSTAVPDSLAAPYGYTVYRHLPGEALDVGALSERERGAAVDALAAFLKALHGFKPPPELEAVLPKEDPRAVEEEYREIASRKIMPRLTRSEARALRVKCDRYVETLGDRLEPAVLHADLSSEHILIADHAIAGVIDFGDVNLGDPDYDFMYLFLDCGWEFTEAVALKYGHSNRERLHTRLRYFSIVDQIDTIAHGEGIALTGQERDAWNRLRQILKADSNC